MNTQSAVAFENTLDYGTKQKPALVDWLLAQATPLFTDAYTRAGTPVQRAVQRAYVGLTPECMLDSLELMSCDVTLRDGMRFELAAMARAFRRAHVTTGLAQ